MADYVHITASCRIVASMEIWFGNNCVEHIYVRWQIVVKSKNKFLRCHIGFYIEMRHLPYCMHTRIGATSTIKFKFFVAKYFFASVKKGSLNGTFTFL